MRPIVLARRARQRKRNENLAFWSLIFSVALVAFKVGTFFPR